MNDEVGGKGNEFTLVRREIVLFSQWYPRNAQCVVSISVNSS